MLLRCWIVLCLENQCPPFLNQVTPNILRCDSVSWCNVAFLSRQAFPTPGSPATLRDSRKPLGEIDRSLPEILADKTAKPPHSRQEVTSESPKGASALLNGIRGAGSALLRADRLGAVDGVELVLDQGGTGRDAQAIGTLVCGCAESNRHCNSSSLPELCCVLDHIPH